MAYETGTASDYLDLLQRIKTFITTNPVLVADNENWTVDESAADRLIAHGPGLSGTEAIYIGIKAYENADADYYNFSINVFTGYVPGNAFDEQPGRRTDNVGMPLWNDQISYYIRANGQQITLLAKIETVYMSLHAGKFLAYATPGQYPLPLVLCSMLPTDSATRYDAASVGMYLAGPLPIRFVDGTWKNVSVWPFYQHRNWSSIPSHFSAHALRDTLDTYPAIPPMLYDSAGLYGELDGIYFCSGFANAVENTITINGDTHIIWRDGSATGFDDYFSMELT